MKTKIVYVVTSSSDDIYFEQAVVSAWSARQYVKDVQIVLVTDSDTLKVAKASNRNTGLLLFDDIVPVDFAATVTNKVKSRQLKTSLRDLVSGDYLFIDSDTIVSGDLNHVDDFDFNLGMVLDLHIPLVSHPFEKGIKKTHRKLFGESIPTGINYFNSGVIFARDTKAVHDFYHEWNKNWSYCLGNFNSVVDQPPLLKTDIDFNGFITPMDGNLNCQILSSIQYLHTAAIMHFFNTTWSKTTMSPFFGKSFYQGLKDSGKLSEGARKMIVNCKSSFTSPSMPIQLEDMKLWLSSSYGVLKLLHSNSILSFASDLFCRCVLKLYRLFARGGGGYNCRVKNISPCVDLRLEAA